MIQKKHSEFRFQVIRVFIFLFLNCLFAATPFLNASPITNVSGFPVQNHSTDQEENNHLNDIPDIRQEHRLTQRDKQKKTHQDFGIKKSDQQALFVNDAGVRFIAYHTSWIRPHYYSFLSLYYLV